MSKKQHIGPTLLVQIYVGLGETDQAFKCLEEIYAGRYPLMLYLKVDPAFDSLRSDPRFADLLRRIGLPQ